MNVSSGISFMAPDNATRCHFGPSRVHGIECVAVPQACVERCGRFWALSRGPEGCTRFHELMQIRRNRGEPIFDIRDLPDSDDPDWRWVGVMHEFTASHVFVLTG
jgi:hypothetical protein